MHNAWNSENRRPDGGRNADSTLVCVDLEYLDVTDLLRSANDEVPVRQLRRFRTVAICYGRIAAGPDPDTAAPAMRDQCCLQRSEMWAVHGDNPSLSEVDGALALVGKQHGSR